MSVRTINDLPREIIITVLRFLDQRSFLNASLTCKLWKILIESSCRWSLIIHPTYDRGKMDFLLTTNRKFRSFSLNDQMSCTGPCKFEHTQEEQSEKLLKIFQRHGFEVVELHLDVYHFQHIDQVAELLSSMPNLKYLTVSQISTSGESLQRSSPQLNHLTTLNIRNTNSEIIKCLVNAKVTTLKFHLSTGSEHLEHFLRSQEELKSLDFRSMYDMLTLFRNIALNGPVSFQLTQLSLIDLTLSDSPSTVDFEHLVKFLAQQAKTLKILRLGCDFPNFVYEFIFSKMTELNTLCVYLPKNKDLWEGLSEHRGIDTVIVMDSSNQTYKFIPDFLKKMPNIRHLTVLENYCVNETYIAMAQCLNRIESLAIIFLDDHNHDSFRGVRFRNLKTLEIYRLSCKFDWNEFTKSHSQLTELTIENVDAECLDSEDFNEITSNVSLKSLKLGYGFVPDDRFFEIMNTKCPDLQVLDLCSSVPCIREGLKRRTDCNVLRLRDNICATYLYLCDLHDFIVACI